MENVVFKYSDFFEDDGGFEQVNKDLDQFGDTIVAKAKKIKKEFSDAINLDDLDLVSQTEEQVEQLFKANKKYADVRKDVSKIEEEYLKTIKKTNQNADEQIDNLVKLDKKLQGYRSELKEINTIAKLGLKTDRDLNKERVEATLNIKKTTKEIGKHQKEILESNQLTKEETKLLKAKITLEKEEIKTLQDVRERMAALRVVVQSLDLETQADQIKAFNDEINDLTDILSANSDKFIQNKINVGNYEESIISALKNTSVFATGIGALDNALESVLGLFLLTKEELDAMEKSMDASTSAVKRFAVAFGKLNKVLKASIIGVVILAIAALGSAFGNTRAGAIRLEKVMITISSAFSTFGKVASIVFEEVGKGFKAITEFIKNPFSSANKKAAEETEGTWERIKKAIESGKEAIIVGLENVDKAFKLEDKVRRLNQEIARLNGNLQRTQLIADDSTRSLNAQLAASGVALELQNEVGEKRIEIAKAELEAANERVKQSILANTVEVENINLGATGLDFAKATLDLAERRGAELEIANDLIDAQQQAVLGVIEAEEELKFVQDENAKLRREINRDLFEQNLDLLIDLVDTEKNISEQFVNDVRRNFQKRINEFNRFLIVFRENAQRELDEFTKEASNLGLSLDFQIEYDDNGDFKVFVNDSELATDNILELNKQLQSMGLNEIDINRFREFIVEARNGVRDFSDLNKELTLVGIKVGELQKNISVSEDELNALDNLQEKINNLSQTLTGGISESESKKILEQIQILEDQKKAIIEFADQQRLDNRIDAINQELKTVEEGSERYYELLQERLDIEKQIREKAIDDTLNKQKETNKKALEDYEKFADDVREVLNKVLDKVLEVNQKRVESAEDQVDRQSELIDIQRRRAEEGLTNTLAFEQRELGKREADLVRRQKKQERLEKIKALYSSYNNYASKGDENPILKALRDFAILEAIAASFKEGGLTGIDGVNTNAKGITLGKSHDPNGRGGNLAWHERGEGFFSRKEVDAMGHDNFYKLKNMAGQGQIDSNFFTRQRKDFITVVPVTNNNPELLRTMKEVKKSIDMKPVPKLDYAGITDGMIELVETILTKNKITRNTFKSKRPRV